MTNTVTVQPDPELIHGVLASGGEDLKKCYQCATCVSVCALATEDQTFPRPQVMKAQWGLKDQLMGDPGVWLCHNCGECTTYCPRGARPGDILGAVRSQLIRALSFPRFMGRLVASPRAVALLFALPVLVLALLAVYPPATESGHPFEFADLFPQARLEALFFTVAGLVTLAFVVSAVRLVREVRAAGAGASIIAALPAVLLEIGMHRRFADCTSGAARRWGHLLTLFGFVGLAIVGTVVGIASLLGLMHTPLELESPWKIFANFSALLILAGMGILLANRLADRALRRGSTYFDWFFMLTLAGVVVTGILSEILRLRQVEIWMFTIYFIHLVLIFALFLYAPYSKFAHFLYRTLAMAATRRKGPRFAEARTPDLPATAGANRSS